MGLGMLHWGPTDWLCYQHNNLELHSFMPGCVLPLPALEMKALSRGHGDARGLI